MDLNECYRKGFIRRTKVNIELIKSLMEMSKINEITVKTAKINDVNISPYVTLAYNSLREVLEAICVSKGYKVLSNVCMGKLLKKIIKDFDYLEFDRLRYVRNGINYYGSKMSLKQGMEFIHKIFRMKTKLINGCLKNFK